jgi:hypothetical protein
MLAGFALFAIAAATAADDGKTGGVWRWEYRIVTRSELAALGDKNIAAGLNKLGEEGWELVAIEPGFTAPPGAGGSTDSQYCFKRPKDLPFFQRASAARRVATAEAEVEMWRERAAYSERMYKKGFLTENQAQFDRLRLRQAELTLDAAKRELEALPPERTPPPKESPAKEPQSKETPR